MTRWKPERSHSIDAVRYAEDVVSGEVVAGEYVRYACQRFLNDLQEGRWHYDEREAQRAVNFIQAFEHVKGAKWARRPFRLRRWQKFIICNLFGWKDPDTGYYRFSEAYLEIPRKNGKSPMSAGIGLYKFVGEDEPGAEIYSGATSEKQAWEVFRPARLMAKRNDHFLRRYGVQVHAKSLTTEDGSIFCPIIGKPGDGASPHCAIVDEYHEHKTPDLVDTMRTGMVGRDNALLLQITTAGVDTGSPCYENRGNAVQVLDGRLDMDHLFAVIYTIDENDAWDTMDAARKANPNLGVSVSEEKIKQQLDQARASATAQNAYRTKHLNQWVGAKSAWLNVLIWKKLGEPGLRPSPGQRIHVALDLATRNDICSGAVLWDDEDEPNRVNAYSRHFVPEARLKEDSRYRAWQEQGYLVTTPGEVTSFNLVQQWVEDLAAKYEIIDVALDPWQAAQLMTTLQDEAGLEVVEYRHTIPNMSLPMKTLEELILQGYLRHDANEVMNWMAGNVIAWSDPKDNIYPRKETREAKIDGMVALIMATGRWSLNEDDDVDWDLVSNPVRG